MASVVDELNELLSSERGEVEAVDVLIKQLAETDADIAESAADALRTASWSCSGLYHRINQLHGSTTLDSTNLAEELSARPDAKSKLEFLCAAQERDKARTESILRRKDLDNTTRSFLIDLTRAHEETLGWCETVLDEWEVGR